MTLDCKNAGICVTGKSHVDKNKPCQDKVYHKESNGVSVITLADGSSSAIMSDVGAEIVTKIGAEFICNNFLDLIDEDEKEISESILKEVTQQIQNKSSELNLQMEDFASTFLFAGVFDNQYLAGHIGDGLIGIFEDEEAKILSLPDNGEHSNETYFISDKNALKHFRIYKSSLNTNLGFILMSDGSYESLIDKKAMKPTKGNWEIFSWLLDEKNTKEKIEEALKINIENLFLSKTRDDCSINLLAISHLVEELPWYKAWIANFTKPITDLINPHRD